MQHHKKKLNWNFGSKFKEKQKRYSKKIVFCLSISSHLPKNVQQIAVSLHLMKNIPPKKDSKNYIVPPVFFFFSSKCLTTNIFLVSCKKIVVTNKFPHLFSPLFFWNLLQSIIISKLSIPV